jgi:hypothetical protein
MCNGQAYRKECAMKTLIIPKKGRIMEEVNLIVKYYQNWIGQTKWKEQGLPAKILRCADAGENKVLKASCQSGDFEIT